MCLLGAVSRAIVKAAGRDLLDKLQNFIYNHGYLDMSNILVTYAYDLTNFKHIFHVVSPNYADYVDLLEGLFARIIKSAVKNKIKSIVLPFIGTG